MSYRKNNKGKFNRRNNSGNLEVKEFPGSLPTPEKVSSESLTYVSKAFKDLQFVGSIEVKADPNSAILKGGYPYSILARTNKVIDANYAGRDNIEGNIITRLQNSNASQLLNKFDVVSINLRANYLYLCYVTNDTTNHNNLAVNMEMLKAINEAISKGYSTMLTQLPFYQDVMETNMPAIPGLTDYQNDIYQKLGALLHYQTVLQNAETPIAKYIETMSLEDHIMTMSYRREAPLITSLYGLLHKAAFKATLNAIGSSVIGEYFDLNWFRQNNTLYNIPSRKSNSMVDPLMTATVTTCIPTLKMKVRNAETYYYDSTSTLLASGIFYNPDTRQMEGTTQNPKVLSFEELIYRVNRMLDVSSILAWARQCNTDASQLPSAVRTPSGYYERINELIASINVVLTKFTTSMTEIRTFIDKLEQSNMVYWKKGVTLNVDRVTTAEPSYNVILHNLICAYIGGSKSMTYDANTQRWQATTLWHKYTGIPTFDTKSGGSFITFGVRNLSLGGLSTTDIAMCIPVAFAPELTQGSSKCVAVSRLGKQIELTSADGGSIAADPVLARLDPLLVGFDVKIPYVDISSGTVTNEKKRLASACLDLLLTLIGYGQVKLSSTITTSAVDSDILCFIDVQIEDVTNEMIQFCRNYSPFRIMTPDGKRTIGFGSK